MTGPPLQEKTLPAERELRLATLACAHAPLGVNLQKEYYSPRQDIGALIAVVQASNMPDQAKTIVISHLRSLPMSAHGTSVD